jgi:hypothetical protein
MKVIWTLKNSPSPHIQAKATEFPHHNAFNQRKFMPEREHPPAHWASGIVPTGPILVEIGIHGLAKPGTRG